MKRMSFYKKESVSDHSIQMIQTINRRRSCECSECACNKKLQFCELLNTQFLPYQQIAQTMFEKEREIKEKETKKKQQLQQRLRNKRMNHNKDLFKKAVHAITFQSGFKKAVIPQLCHAVSLKDLNQVRTNLKRQTTVKLMGQSQHHLLPATQLDIELNKKIELICTKTAIPIFVQGSQDDFKVKLRINIHIQEQTQKQHQPLIHFEMESEVEEQEESISMEQTIPKKNPSIRYKQILQYNKKSFTNLVQQAQLTEMKTIKKIVNENYQIKCWTGFNSVGYIKLNTNPNMPTLSTHTSLKVIKNDQKNMNKQNVNLKQHRKNKTHLV